MSIDEPRTDPDEPAKRPLGPPQVRIVRPEPAPAPPPPVAAPRAVDASRGAPLRLIYRDPLRRPPSEMRPDRGIRAGPPDWKKKLTAGGGDTIRAPGAGPDQD